MTDLEGAVRKMERVCEGTVHLYWFAGTPSWDALPVRIWPRLHGKPYDPMPRGDVLFNVLYGMGIFPDLSHFPFRTRSRFSCPEQAVSYLAPRYRARTHLQKSILREELETELERLKDGWVLHHTALCMHLWWQPSGPGIQGRTNAGP
jgi:hypothetical protein